MDINKCDIVLCAIYHINKIWKTLWKDLCCTITLIPNSVRVVQKCMRSRFVGMVDGSSMVSGTYFIKKKKKKKVYYEVF